MSTNSDVIDLTDSFTLINHRQLADVIIELDDSLHGSPAPILANSVRNSTPIRTSTRRSTTTAKRLSTAKTKTSKLPVPTMSTSGKENSKLPVPSKSTSAKENSKGVGDCPVCWDQLGRNSLASTKCGHVFCLKCISQVVQQTKRCPTCRCVLKGSSAYHPLYLCL